MDTQVLEIQKWMNKIYSSHAAWSGSPEDGSHGGTTVFSLIQALQAELGYSNLSGNFGPGTLSNVPTMKNGRLMDNFTTLLKGALWRAGYSGGNLLTPINEVTVEAIKELQGNIGINKTGEVDGYLWKALMTTDGYVTTWSNGSENLRRGQQYLNHLVIEGVSFSKSYLSGYLPCDGLSGRRLSTAIIKLIQANIGYGPLEASGNLGPATQNALPILQGGSSPYITVSKLALLANGYEIPNTNPVWDLHLTERINEFQNDMSLPITSKLNFSTWMALLISYGDKNRKHTACDTRFEITSSRLLKLKSMGITAVGRYINGTSFKILAPGEVERIIDGGLGLIPIYQENGTSTSNFSEEIGKQQAKKAQVQAIIFNIPIGSILYFAVDYDALGSDITNHIIPYFKGIRSVLSGYKIGVYGTRNVCQRISDAGFSKSSYVSNMSSGFSGNLGFKMPTNWNFDQFDEITIDDWGIDRVSYSGKHPYVEKYSDSLDISESEMNPTNVTINQLNEKIKMLEWLAYKFISTEDELIKNYSWEHTTPAYMILNYLRHFKYSTGKFALVLSIAPSSEKGFYNYVIEQAPNLHNYFFVLAGAEKDKHMIVDQIGGRNDLGHFAFTTLGYALPSLIPLMPRFWTGWGGDCATLGDEISNLRGEVPDGAINPEDYSLLLKEQIKKARARLGALSASASSFSLDDFCADSDAIFIGKSILEQKKTGEEIVLSSIIEDYYKSVSWKQRGDNFIIDFGLDINKSYTHVELTSEIYFTLLGLLENFIMWPILGGESKPIDIYAVADAFSNYILTKQ